MKDAAELASADGAQLFERAMESLVRPAMLPAKAAGPIIDPTKAGNKNTANKTKKSGSAE
ncbi:hypothetical protein [Methylibium sp.]|uniref:hypothetical protein n=1 Tax=Methylibium sp. TaxID=2067992 RepID=UPI003BAAE9F8